MKTRMHIRFLAILALVFSFFSQSTAQVTAETKRQILALLEEKASRTPAQQKMESQLIQAVKESRGQKMAVGVNLVPINVKKTSSGLVLVDINATVTDALLNNIKALGGKIVNAYPQYHAIRAEISLAVAETIAGYPEVTILRFADQAETVGAGNPNKVNKNNMTDVPLAINEPGISKRKTQRKPFEKRAAEIKKKMEDYIMTLGTGGVKGQGDRAHRADDTRNTYGYQGQGIRIGVLSDTYNSLGGAAANVASGDLPGVGNPLGNTTPVTVVTDFAGGSDEGRAMLHIVHDVAPKAQLFVASAFNSQADFAANILTLRNTYNCDIIIDDIFYFAEAAFQDGIVAQAVNTVTASGALYFSSAGNSGNIGKGTAGVWEGDFNDAGSAAFAFPGGTKAGTIHNWGTVGTPVNGNILTAKPSSVYFLKWAEPQGASSNDYDLFLLSSTGTVKGSATTVQNGTQDPYEQVSASPALVAGDRLVVFKANGAAALPFHLNANRGRLTVVTGGQTHGHSSAADGYSVAATPAAATFGAPTPNGPFPGPFTAASQVEPFSSQGLRRIFFNANGTPVTPGNISFATNGGVVRNKPDITAADGVATSMPAGGLNPFYGTSAAAPYAGAIAALLKSANPSLTPAQMRTILTTTALDIEGVGYDNVSGHGIVQAFQAMQAVNPTPLATLNTGTVTFSEGSPSNSNTFIEPGETGTLVVQLLNPSLANATVVSATATSSTPNVSFSTSTASYGNIAASGNATNSATPFVFSVGTNVPCGTIVNVSLTVTYTGGISPQTFVLSFVAANQPITSLSSSLGSAPASGAGFTAASGNQTGRLNRFAPPSACGVVKANPGLAATTGARAYHAYTFTNTGASSQCVTISLSTTGSPLYVAAYNNSGFVPATPNVNWAADAGSSSANTSFSYSAPAGQAFTVVVHEVNSAGGIGVAYTLNLSTTSCSPVPIIVPTTPVTIIAENALPLNNAADPGETLTVNLPLLNIGASNTTNLVATLQPTGGVTNPNGPRNYGVIANGGAAVSQPFTFTAAGNCGDFITLTLALQDGAVDAGTATYTMQLGNTIVTPIVSQNFDGVTAPALPSGWTTEQTGTTPPALFATTATSPNSSPNAVFSNGVGTVASNSLVSPVLNIPTTGIKQLSFSHALNFESNTTRFDGAVLEVSVDGGTSYVDITAPGIGGSFVAGGYTAVIDNTFSNPLGGRQSWGGINANYTTVTINLPAAFGGANVKFRWRAGWDNSTGNAGPNWRIDDISLNLLTSNCSTVPVPPSVTINQAAGQVDPTSTSPINFTVTFNEAVTGFATGDITLSGTAGATTATVTGPGPIYNVAVTGMAGSGTVIATIAANVANSTSSTLGNTASTSTDNTVTYNQETGCGPVTTRIYVDASAAPGGTGSSWTCALQQLSTAITMANGNMAIKSIWVADGTYKPGASRTDVMAITRADLMILGGFAGGEANAMDANPAVNQSIISGDIGVANDMSDNSYRLMNIGGSPVSASQLVVDGFVFENGNANGAGDRAVGAAILSNGIPVATPVWIKRSLFRNNNAVSSGGAVYLTGANLAFDGCRFVTNTAGSAGGAVFSFQASPAFTNSVFVGNTAPNGGGYYGNYGYPTFNKTAFSGNSATYGGGVYQNRMGADYFNCVFNANTSFQGGAIYEQSASTSHILNSTFFKNTGVSYGGTIVLTGSNSSTVTENSIFWKNTHGGSATSPWADFVNYTGGANVYANNILQMNTAVPADNGTTRRFNKRGVDPLFTNELSPVGADVMWGTADDGLQLQDCAPPAGPGINVVSIGCSPALNAGDNTPVTAAGLTTDERNNPRIVCTIVDMGAYENQNCGAATGAEQEVISMAKTITTNGVTGIVANPFANELQIRYTGAEKAGVTVYAASGKTMWSKTNITEGITRVNSSSWARGMYQVVIVTANGKRINFKVVRL